MKYLSVPVNRSHSGLTTQSHLAGITAVVSNFETNNAVQTGIEGSTFPFLWTIVHQTSLTAEVDSAIYSWILSSLSTPRRANFIGWECIGGVMFLAGQCSYLS